LSFFSSIGPTRGGGYPQGKGKGKGKGEVRVAKVYPWSRVEVRVVTDLP